MSSKRVSLSEGNFLFQSRTIFYDDVSDAFDQYACVVPSKPVWIAGAGREKTFLKVDNSIIACAIGSRQISHLQIEDLTIDGNKANNPNDDADGNQCGIYTGTLAGISPSHLIYRNLYIKDCPQLGIYVGANSDNPYLENIIVEGCGYDGVDLDQTWGATLVHLYLNGNNVVGTADRGGLGITSLELSNNGVVVVGGYFTNNGWAGIHIKYGRNVTLLSPRCENNGYKRDGGTSAGFGIYVDLSQDVNMFSPQLDYNRYDGVYVKSSSHINIFGGAAKNNCRAADGATWAGVTYNATTHSLVEGIRCYDDQTPKTQSYGIYESGASDHNTFRDNNLNGNAVYAIQFVGSSTKTINNKGYVTEGSASKDIASTSTTSASLVDITGSSFTLDCAGIIHIVANLCLSNSSTSDNDFKINLDGSDVAAGYFGGAKGADMQSIQYLGVVGQSNHTIKLRWATSSGTLSLSGATKRSFVTAMISPTG